MYRYFTEYISYVLIFACVRHLAATVSKKSELREEAVEALADELRAAAESALAPGGPRFLPLRCCGAYYIGLALRLFHSRFPCTRTVI